jgi:hypothetical protein
MEKNNGLDERGPPRGRVPRSVALAWCLVASGSEAKLMMCRGTITTG